MIRKMSINKIFFTAATAIAILFSGCSSAKNSTAIPTSEPQKVTSTPIPAAEDITTYGPLCKVDLSYIQFPDGAALYFGPETDLEILSLPDLTTGKTDYEIQLNHGHLIILSQPPQDIQITVVSPDGYVAQFTGSIMYVGFEEDSSKYIAICVTGVCDLGSDLQSLVHLPEGNMGWLNEGGDFVGPFAMEIDALSEGCGEDYISVVIPPTATPDIDATATAFCGDFEEENPGTPCP